MDFHERCSSWVFKLIILAFVFSCTFIAKFGIHLKSFKIHVTDEKPREDRNQTPVCQSNRVDDIPEKTKLPPLLKDFKCPCWIERNTFDTATRVRCLPYFYLVGMPKCGTTDFFSRITYHPSISNKSKKETHWFSRRRFNINGKYRLLSSYIQFYDGSVKEDVLKSKQADGSYNGIFGDFSGTYWDNRKLLINWTGQKGSNPQFTLADVIFKLNPNSKIIFLLRNPVKRIYSEYLYFGNGKTKSANDFHAKIKAAIQRHWYCLKRHCLQYCSYFYVSEGVRLEVSIYHVYVEDYFSVFPRDQVHIVKTENFSTNMQAVVADVFRFLEIENSTEEIMTAILALGKKKVNTRQYALHGQMLPETKALLSDFYKAHNEKLNELLGIDMEFD